MINTFKPAPEALELCNKLTAMKFSGMAKALEEVLMDPNSELYSFEEKISKIVDAEWDLRYTKKFNRFLKKATLKYPEADIDETINEPDRMLDAHLIEALSTCKWIKEGKNLVIEGKTSSGKTYLANALCVCAIKDFMNVKYTKASELITTLNRAEKTEIYIEEIAKIKQYDLLVIDDFGLMNLDIEKCRYLFEALDCRDPNKSTLVISQFPVSSWYDIFEDKTYSEACLSRLLRNSYRINMNGRNMRNIEPLNK